MIGIGLAKGKKFLARASHDAMTSSIVDGVSFFDATSLFVRIITPPSISLSEILEEIWSIQNVASEDASVSIDWVADENMGMNVLVSIFGSLLEC